MNEETLGLMKYILKEEKISFEVKKTNINGGNDIKIKSCFTGSTFSRMERIAKETTKEEISFSYFPDENNFEVY